MNFGCILNYFLAQRRGPSHWGLNSKTWDWFHQRRTPQTNDPCRTPDSQSCVSAPRSHASCLHWCENVSVGAERKRSLFSHTPLRPFINIDIHRQWCVFNSTLYERNLQSIRISVAVFFNWSAHGVVTFKRKKSWVVWEQIF